jgi:hypothetical protein
MPLTITGNHRTFARLRTGSRVATVTRECDHYIIEYRPSPDAVPVSRIVLTWQLALHVAAQYLR